jgi:hypothetical protein
MFLNTLVTLIIDSLFLAEFGSMEIVAGAAESCMKV